jgi:hypothetical protein
MASGGTEKCSTCSIVSNVYRFGGGEGIFVAGAGAGAFAFACRRGSLRVGVDFGAAFLDFVAFVAPRARLVDLACAFAFLGFARGFRFEVDFAGVDRILRFVAIALFGFLFAAIVRQSYSCVHNFCVRFVAPARSGS